MDESTGLSRWFWIELIGFDNELADFGVGEFLARTGFVPEVVALLLFNPDFVHAHDGMETDRELQPDICCYGAYPASEERERQVWTKAQLRGLVVELRLRGPLWRLPERFLLLPGRSKSSPAWAYASSAGVR